MSGVWPGRGPAAVVGVMVLVPSGLSVGVAGAGTIYVDVQCPACVYFHEH